MDDCNKVSLSNGSQIDHKLNTKTESDNIISDHIKHVHQTLRFTFLIKFASIFKHY